MLVFQHSGLGLTTVLRTGGKVSMLAEKHPRSALGCRVHAHIELCLPDMPEREGWQFRAQEMIKAVLSAPKGLPFSTFQREHQRGLTASLPPTSLLQGLCQDARSSNQSPGKAAAAFPAFLTSTMPGSDSGLRCALPAW